MSDKLWDILNRFPYNLKKGHLIRVDSGILRNRYCYDEATGQYEVGLLVSDAITLRDIDDDDCFGMRSKIYHKKVYRVLFQGIILTINQNDILGRVDDNTQKNV